MKLEEINLCDLDQFTSGCPRETFQALRSEAPVFHHSGRAELPPALRAPDGESFWVVSRHADAKAVLKNYRVFSSETGQGARQGGGTTLADIGTDMAPGLVLAMTDPPKHTAIRNLVNQGFTPKNLELLMPRIQALTDEILGAVEGHSEVNFLDDVAAQLPLRVICILADVPRQDWPRMKVWADAAIAFAAHDAEADHAALAVTLGEMQIYAYNLVRKLRETPGDSIMSKVIDAEIVGDDGQLRRLDDLELVRFFSLLITAGTETTRNAIAGGYYQLLTHPEQLRALEAEPERLMMGAVEEILRWTSPVHFNRRTASEACVLRGQAIVRGESAHRVRPRHPPLPRRRPRAARDPRHADELASAVARQARRTDRRATLHAQQSSPRARLDEDPDHAAGKRAMSRQPTPLIEGLEHVFG
jgi:cytochrome P450